MTYLMLAVIACFLFVAWRDLKIAFPLFLALLPTYLLRFELPIGGFRLPSTVLEVLALTLIVFWLWRRGRDELAWKNWRRWLMPIALLVVSATIAVLVSPDWRAALGIWRAYFVEPLAFLFVARDLLRDERVRERSLLALSWALIVIGVLACYQKLTAWGIPNPAWQPAATRRITAFYGYPNAVSLFVVPVAVLLIGRLAAWRHSGSWRDAARAATYVLAVISAAFATWFAVSEGGLVALGAGALVVGLLSRRFRAAALVAIIVGCLAVSLASPLRNWAGNIVGLRDDSTSVRSIVWRESLDMLADRPIFGAGLAGYQTALAPYHQAKHIEIFMYPHNFILNFWSELGLAGLVAIVWVVALALWRGWRRYARDPNDWLAPAVLAALVALLVHGLVDVPYFKNDLAFLFWFLVAL